MPVDVLENDGFLPGLLEGSSELIRSPMVPMFRPVFFPSFGPQGQRCARVGTVSPPVVERDVDLERLIGLPQESMGSSRALRERLVAPQLLRIRSADRCVLDFFLENSHIIYNFCGI